ncbi:MAG: hypothetical protein V8Q75_03525 [Bacilli bacterium]
MENLEIYNKVKTVPQNAQKTIQAGRLKGMTDINPQWRIEKLTEVFGPVGIGWYTKELKREFVDGANDEKMCFVDIELYVKVDNEWSKPIYGTGGSTFVAKEKAGLYTSDEVVKMAYTDAISVACKQLGVGADIYWNKSDSKYQQKTNNITQPTTKKVDKPVEMINDNQIKVIHTLFNKIEKSETQIFKNFTNDMAKENVYKQYKITSSKELTKENADRMIELLKKKLGE